MSIIKAAFYQCTLSHYGYDELRFTAQIIRLLRIDDGLSLYPSDAFRLN